MEQASLKAQQKIRDELGREMMELKKTKDNEIFKLTRANGNLKVSVEINRY
jgi:hypothetical protein